MSDKEREEGTPEDETTEATEGNSESGAEEESSSDEGSSSDESNSADDQDEEEGGESEPATVTASDDEDGDEDDEEDGDEDDEEEGGGSSASLLIAVLALGAGFGVGWFGHEYQANKKIMKADAAVQGEGEGARGPCKEWESAICAEFGATSYPCNQAKMGSPLLTGSACEQAIVGVKAKIEDIRAARAPCNNLMNKLCGELGAESKSCELVKTQTPNFPPEKCTEMDKNYDQVLKQLQMMEKRGAFPGGPPGARPPGHPGGPGPVRVTRPGPKGPGAKPGETKPAPKAPTASTPKAPAPKAPATPAEKK